MDAGVLSGAELFGVTILELLLVAAPAIAAVLLALRLGVRGPVELACLGLAAGGGAAMLVFWACLLSAPLGSAAAYALFAGSLGIAVWCRQVLAAERELLGRLAVPLALWALGTLFVLFFGFLHGGTDTALSAATGRFGTDPTQLASDNFIPWFFSNWMAAGHHGAPPIFHPRWRFSDRPPLQVAYLLSARPFGWDATTLHAQVIGSVVQELWIVGLWAALVAARVSDRARSLVLIAAFASDVAILNGFFVWPKLLAAAFVLAALALVLAPGESPLRRSPAGVALLAALAGLALLAHGSSAFGLVPVAAIAVARGLPGWRWLAAGAAVFLLLVAPWMAYQRYGDPPGNRVVKWALAGVTRVTDRTTTEEISRAYSRAGLGGALHDKLENFLTMAGGGPDTAIDSRTQWIHFGSAFTDTANAVSYLGQGRLGKAISEVRESRFSHLLWALGLLALGLPLIAYGRLSRGRPSGPDWRFARLCLVACALAAVTWGLIVFGNVPARATIVEGSLAVPLIGVAGVVAGLLATFPRWASGLVAANAATVVLLYAPDLSPLPRTSYSAFAILAAAAALAGFVMVALGRGLGDRRAAVATSG